MQHDATPLFLKILSKLRPRSVEAGTINHNVCRKTYEKQILESGPLSNPVDGPKSRMRIPWYQVSIQQIVHKGKCSEFLGAGGLSS